MSRGHLTRELLRAATRGRLSPRELTPVVLAHLELLCPRCRRVLAEWNAELAASNLARWPRGGAVQAAEGPAPAPAGEEGGADAEELPPAVEAELGPWGAERLAEELPQRLAARRRAEELLLESRACLPGDPAGAAERARRARALLRPLAARPETVALYARALAHEGNALRARGDLPAAADLLAAARYLLRTHGTGDRLDRAELDSFEGSLLRDQRRLPEAAALLHRAAIAYGLARRPLEGARALLKLGLVHREVGEYEEAISATRKALKGVMQADEEPRLLLMGLHNLACFHADAGRFAEARELLEQSAEIYATFPDTWSLLQRHWVAGTIARGLGEGEAAEAAYRAARDGFLAQGVGYDAALVSLDLALLYLEQRRTGEVRRLAREMLPVFQAQDIHREAFAALLLFQEAARSEELTLAFVAEVKAYLEAARSDPQLAFRVRS